MEMGWDGDGTKRVCGGGKLGGMGMETEMSMDGDGERAEKTDGNPMEIRVE